LIAAGEADPSEKQLAYLAGQGWYQASSPTRPAQPFSPGRFAASVCPPGATGVLRVGVRCSSGDPATARFVAAAALRCIEIVGGLGARTRRMFGGISFDRAHLSQLADEPIHDDLFKVANRTLEVLGLRAGAQPDLPLYTQISAGTMKQYPTMKTYAAGPEEALGAVGKHLRLERTIERKGHKRYPAYRKRTTPDYESVIIPILDGRMPKSAFTLPVLGLPIQMQRHSDPRKVSITPEGFTGRPSLLILRPTTRNGDLAVSIWTSRELFLPSDKITAIVSAGHHDTRVPLSQPELLDRLGTVATNLAARL
jgi:hypothetical protein